MASLVNIRNQALDANDVIFNAPLGVGVTRADEYDIDLIGAVVGQPITISLTADDPGLAPNKYDPLLEVIDANTGNLLAQDDDGGGNRNSLINALTIEGGKDYKIRVTSYGGLNQPGNYPYDLQVAVPQGDVLVQPRESSFNGEVQTGNFVIFDGELNEDDFTFPAPTGGATLVDEYQLSVQIPGQSVNISVASNDSSMDPYLEVIDARTGQVINFDNDSGGGVNSQLNFGSQPGIDYRVRVTNNSASNTNSLGGYRLTASVGQGDVTLTARGEGAGPITDPTNPTIITDPTDPLTGNIEVVRFWDFRAEAHIFTADPSEINALTQNSSQFREEGVEFRTPSSSTPGVLPVYEYKNVVAGTSFYTMETPDVITSGFPALRADDIAFYAFPPNQAQPQGTVPVHRFFNRGTSQESGSPVHFFTGTESNKLRVQQDFPDSFIYENAGWFAYPGESV
jgi:hypothetical protein